MVFYSINLFRWCLLFSFNWYANWQSALIVTLQPILTNALAGKFLGEKVSFKQWIGVILGFIGAALVLGFDIGTSLPVIGIVASFIALLAITTSTLWQKKIGNNLC